MRLGQLVIDVAPLRSSAAFRLVLTAQAITMVGTQLALVGANLLAFRLTGSSLQVGLVGLTLGAALLAGLLTGGVVADRVDRKKLIMTTRSAVVLVLAALAANAALPEPRLWVLYVTAALVGGVNGLGGPALMAVTPALVGSDQLAAAGALTALTAQLGAVVGPALAGLIAAGPGIAWCFAIDAACFALAVALLSRLPAIPPPAHPRVSPLRSIAEGWTFVRRNEVVRGVLLIDVVAMVFAMPFALFPELGLEWFHGGPAAVGLLYTAPAVGAFLAAVGSGWTGRVRRAGWALIAAVALWGAAVACVGLTASLPVALVLLAVAGAGDTTSEILRRALLQHHTPDHLQGRVSSLWIAQASAGPAAGNAEAGLMARLITAPGALLLGGLVCVAGVAVLAVSMPAFRAASLRGPGVGTEPKESTA